MLNAKFVNQSQRIRPYYLRMSVLNKVGVLKSIAQLFSQNLIGQGYDSYIQKVVFNSEEIWYRVRVGSYDNYNSAKTAADALSSTLGMPTWVDFVRKEQ